MAVFIYFNFFKLLRQILTETFLFRNSFFDIGKFPKSFK